MNSLITWQTYLDGMDLGEENEIHCLEFSPSRANTTVRSLFLEKVTEHSFRLSIRRANILAHTEETEYEIDEHGNYVYPDEIRGEQVRAQLGDYWVGFDFEPYPDEKNIFDFEHICEPGVASWLEKNGWSTLSEITPGEEVS